MARQLAYYVHLEDEDGTPFVFGPEDTLPAWAKKKITNPSAWGEGEDDADDDLSTVAARAASDGSAAGGTGDDGSGDGSTPPADAKAAAYDQLLKGDLEAEVERRNAGRDDADKVVVKGNGNKPDLVKALKADDKAQAAQA